MNRPTTVWPSNKHCFSNDIQWLVDNYLSILKAKGSPRGEKTRPILIYNPSNKVRLEFVGTFETAADAVKQCKKILENSE